MTLFCHCCTNQRSDACLISSSCNLANLIVNHNLSYETVTSSIPSQSKAAVASDDEEEKALLPKVVEMVLKRRTYFKELLKQIPKENIDIMTGLVQTETVYMIRSLASASCSSAC
jgi:DNA polymerase elongation subunit (family B)